MYQSAFGVVHDISKAMAAIVPGSAPFKKLTLRQLKNMGHMPNAKLTPIQSVKAERKARVLASGLGSNKR